MMFKEGKCPVCQEKIQVPDDREQIICMFCGKEILVKDALKKTVEEHVQLSEEASREYEALAEAKLKELITSCDNPMNSFKRTTYEGEFDAYYAANRGLFEAMDMLYTGSSDPDQLLQKMTDCLISTAKEELEKLRSKGKKTKIQLDYNFLVSIYLVPAVRKYPASFAEPFAECLVTAWNQAFGCSIGKATYAEITNGFRRKLCYITTAVCESLGKGADCYELRLLKEYRDQYMEKTPEGHALVQEYYDIAPTIVKRMEKEPERDTLYQELYEQYLMPCIHEIEEGAYEACCSRYESMVLDLKNRYFH